MDRKSFRGKAFLRDLENKFKKLYAQETERLMKPKQQQKITEWTETVEKAKDIQVHQITIKVIVHYKYLL